MRRPPVSYRTAGDPGMFDDTRVDLGGKSFFINYHDTPAGSLNGGNFAHAVTLTAIPPTATAYTLQLRHS